MLALSLRTTVRAALIGLALGSIAVLGATSWAYIALDRVNGKISFVNAFSTNVSKLNLLTAELFIHRSERIEQQWSRQHKLLTRQLSELPDFEGQAVILTSEIERRLELITKIANRLQANSTFGAGGTASKNETRGILFEIFIVQSSAITEHALELRNAVANYMNEQRRQILLFIGCGFLALMLTGGLVFFLVSNRLLSRILNLRSIIQEIGTGNLEADIPSSAKDEMGDVFHELDRMRGSLLQSMGELSKVNLELVAAKADLENRVAERTAGLETVNKELEAFTYAVSHDLRAPLRGISGFSQAVLEDYGKELPVEGQSMLRRIHSATQRMSQLIDDLLKLSRLRKSLMDVAETDLSEMAAEICQGLQERAPHRNVSFKIEESAKLRCDAGLMRIVLTNLIENAWKFTAEKPDAEIVFGMRAEGSAQTLYVRDNGAGFDMAFSERLFQPFQRLHSEKTFPGTGIGLATVARIVRLHRGKIWAEATPGEGATFYFQLGIDLPCSDDDRTIESSPSADQNVLSEMRKVANG